jgi:DNA invertase Pin-like site-specific DNA recombinase
MITVTASAERIRVLGYVRVSTVEQAESGLGLEAQRGQIEREAQRQGWELMAIFTDAVSGKDMERPQLQAALSMLAQGQASALVVSKLDRLSRSVLDFSQLLQRAGREGWHVITLDLGVDLASETGEAIANVMATFAQLERRLISRRTKEALAAAKARGVKIGRKVQLAPEVEARIVTLAEGGMSRRGIAALLQSEGVPSPTGAERWHDTTVGQVLRRHPEAVVRRPRPGRPERVPVRA